MVFQRIHNKTQSGSSVQYVHQYMGSQLVLYIAIYVILNALPVVIYVVLFCGMRALFFFFVFFLLASVSVYHSKQATEISLWKPVYGLPPHMFAVSL